MGEIRQRGGGLCLWQRVWEQDEPGGRNVGLQTAYAYRYICGLFFCRAVYVRLCRSAALSDLALYIVAKINSPKSNRLSRMRRILVTFALATFANFSPHPANVLSFEVEAMQMMLTSLLQ